MHYQLKNSHSGYKTDPLADLFHSAVLTLLFLEWLQFSQSYLKYTCMTSEFVEFVDLGHSSLAISSVALLQFFLKTESLNVRAMSCVWSHIVIDQCLITTSWHTQWNRKWNSRIPWCFASATNSFCCSKIGIMHTWQADMVIWKYGRCRWAQKLKTHPYLFWM